MTRVWSVAPGVFRGVRPLLTLVVVAGVVAMHGLGLLVAGCGQGGHADGVSAHGPRTAEAGHRSGPGSPEPARPVVGRAVRVVDAPAAAVRAVHAARPVAAVDMAPVELAAWTAPHVGCHLLHLCWAVLAGLGLLVALAAGAWVRERFAVRHSAVTSCQCQARSPPPRRWGPIELCVFRT